MRRLFVLLSVLFVLTGCPQPERTIESTICYIREVNNSSRNIYIQYYYKTPSNNNIVLERIYLNRFSEYNSSGSNYDHCDPGVNYGDSNYRSTPGPGYDSPVETIKKIVIIDVDSHRTLINNPALKGRGMLFLKGIAVGFNTLYNALKGGVLNPPHE